MPRAAQLHLAHAVLAIKWHRLSCPRCRDFITSRKRVQERLTTQTTTRYLVAAESFPIFKTLRLGLTKMFVTIDATGARY